MNPSPHAKIEFREMRLRRMPRCLAALIRWYFSHQIVLNICLIAVVILPIFWWQYEKQHKKEIVEVKLTNASLQNQVALKEAFEQLPDKTFIVRAKNINELYSVFEQIENAALAKRAEAKAAMEESRK